MKIIKKILSNKNFLIFALFLTSIIIIIFSISMYVGSMLKGDRDKELIVNDIYQQDFTLKGNKKTQLVKRFSIDESAFRSEVNVSSLAMECNRISGISGAVVLLNGENVKIGTHDSVYINNDTEKTYIWFENLYGKRLSKNENSYTVYLDIENYENEQNASCKIRGLSSWYYPTNNWDEALIFNNIIKHGKNGNADSIFNPSESKVNPSIRKNRKPLI